MNVKERILSISVCDYDKNIICPIYDNNTNVSGQATDVYLHFEQNGWKEVSFTLPYLCLTLNGMLQNFRIDYIKADYLLKVIRDNDDIEVENKDSWLIIEGQKKEFFTESLPLAKNKYITDWYIISGPKIAHNAKTKTISVTAGHVSHLLKTKNLNLEFSDLMKNNIGTCGEILGRILEGTGWTMRNVFAFGENNGTQKIRTLNCGVRTGAFKMIENLCSLFDAKPIYHGEEKQVDIIPLNSFSKPLENELPDILMCDDVLEMNYGKNLSSIERSYNTLNMITKLFAYGSYGSKTEGYCAIEECNHLEYTFTLSLQLTKGLIYCFTVKSADDSKTYKKKFTPTLNIPSGHKLIYSLLDPASMMYIWDDTSKKAHFVDNGLDGESIGEKQKADAEEVPNTFSFIMNFNYYRKIGLFTQNMLQKVALYQRNMPSYYNTASDASKEMSKGLQELQLAIGVIPYCKLNVNGAGSVKADGLNSSYVVLNIDITNNGYGPGVVYRSDYDNVKENWFKYRKTLQLNADGDAVNDAANVVYIIRPRSGNTPLWWKAYIKDFNDEKLPSEITLWLEADEYTRQPEDKYFLFSYNGINGYLGSLEAQDEAAMLSMEELLRRITVDHPVYFVDGYNSTNVKPFDQKDSISGEVPNYIINTLNVLVPTYAWIWDYKNDQMYFLCPDILKKKDWYKVVYQDIRVGQPSTTNYYFWYDWRNSKLYQKNGTLWEELTSYDWQLIGSYFSVAYMYAMRRNQYYKGLQDKYLYVASSSNKSLPAGNYYFETPYKSYVLFTTKEALAEKAGDHAGNDSLVYDTTNGWILQRRYEYIGVNEPTLTYLKPKIYRFDSVGYHKDNLAEGMGFIDGYIDETGASIDAYVRKTTTLNASGNSVTVTLLLQKVTYTDVDGSKDTNYCCRSDGYIYVVPGVAYKVSIKRSVNGGSYSDYSITSSKFVNVYFYDSNKRFVTLSRGASIKSSSGTFTVPSNVRYVKFVLVGSSVKSTASASTVTKPYDYKMTVTVSNENYKTSQIIVDDIVYTNKQFVAQSGSKTISIPEMINVMSEKSDDVYITKLEALNNAQSDIKNNQDEMTNAIGDVYREGYWQDGNYVDGDLDKLYTDALLRLEKLSEPLAAYNLSYVDLYDANKNVYSYGASLLTQDINWPDVSISSAVHLIDSQIGIDTWGYISKLNKCYDKPWKTNLTVNTDLTNIYKHTFTDVISNLILASNDISQKSTIYDTITQSATSNNELVLLKALVLKMEKRIAANENALAIDKSDYDSDVISFNGYGGYQGYDLVSNSSGGGAGAALGNYNHIIDTEKDLTLDVHNLETGLGSRISLTEDGISSIVDGIGGSSRVDQTSNKWLITFNTNQGVLSGLKTLINQRSDGKFATITTVQTLLALVVKTNALGASIAAIEGGIQCKSLTIGSAASITTSGQISSALNNIILNSTSYKGTDVTFVTEIDKASTYKFLVN